jgi:lipopolysaccharide/colanic/teichoic acid biosynthesis glycosyltransferase
VPRIIELVLAGLALVFLLIPSILVAGFVWATLGRPLLFFQTRVSMGGEHFQIYKFRTMSNARATDGSLLPDEMRETAVTRLLRRLRLDETRQLLAVLTGRLKKLKRVRVV